MAHRRHYRGRSRRRYGRDVYRRVSLKCPKCHRENFLTSKGLNEHIAKAHLRASVKKAYGVGKKRKAKKRYSRKYGPSRTRKGANRRIAHTNRYSDDAPIRPISTSEWKQINRGRRDIVKRHGRRVVRVSKYYRRPPKRGGGRRKR